MARNKLTIDFSGFEEMFEKLDRVGANTKQITEDALQASYEAVTPTIKAAIKPHHFTGQTEKSLAENEKVEWEGKTAYIKVGFNIRKGGLASIFLMYGTPKMSPDRKLYNAIYGSATKKKVKQIQKEVFQEELRKVMG